MSKAARKLYAVSKTSSNPRILLEASDEVWLQRSVRDRIAFLLSSCSRVSFFCGSSIRVPMCIGYRAEEQVLTIHIKRDYYLDSDSNEEDMRQLVGIVCSALIHETARGTL